MTNNNFSDEERERLLAEELAKPVESVNTRRRREFEFEEHERRTERRAERRAARAAEIEREPPPVDWTAHINAAVAAERAYSSEVLTQLIVELRHEHADNLKRETTAQAVEIANLKVAIAELRVEVATERTKAAIAILTCRRSRCAAAARTNNNQIETCPRGQL
jgi:hypothetical protein